MDREAVIRMAREAGISESHAQGMQGFLERFATLVAKHEREACAKVADEQAQDEPYGHAKFRCGNIAAAIRARGNT
jgi:hypothetical protein